MKELADFKCLPCRGNTPTLTADEIASLLPELPEWVLIEIEGIQRLERKFAFKNFTDALAFTNQIGAVAEAEDHHPLIVTEWGNVTVQWWTYAIRGLHKNDFIMAAKIDSLPFYI